MIFVAVWPLLMAGPAGQADGELAAWDLLLGLNFDRAEKFAARRVEDPGAKARDWAGYAIALMASERRTARRFEQAERAWKKVAELAESREMQAFAAYMLLRLRHIHADAQDDLEYLPEYYGLWQEYGDMEVGEASFLKAAMMEMYRVEADEEKRARLLRLEEQAKAMEFPSLRRNFHRAIGEAWARQLGDDEGALRAYRQALQDGIQKWNARGRTLVRAGEHARSLGYWREAAGYYRTFLKDYPRDPRRYEIGLLLREVERRDGQP